MNPAEFCRELEAYLCRKNDGHLIRIVGPVFEQVCGWATQGVPIKIACRGIDRYFERQQNAQRPAGARRRPVRIEFCEADVLDAFDEWRRAVGVSASTLAGEAAPASADSMSPARADARPHVGASSRANGAAARAVTPDERATPDARASRGPDAASSDARGNARGDDGNARGRDADTDAGPARKKTPLLTHIDRVMARLTQRRVDSAMKTALGETIDRALGELDTMRARARGARGETRSALLDRLAAIDRALIDAARAALGPTTLDEARGDAGRELEPFRSRLSPEAFRAATEAALDRLVRDRWRLPSLRLD